MIERDPTKSWLQDTAYFKAQLDLGKQQEKCVAEKLRKYGVTDVIVRDDGFRESLSQISSYTKFSGDLQIKGWPFEVKSRDIVFSSVEDWPANRWPMFIDTVSSFEQKSRKPLGYIFVSQTTGALLAVSAQFAPQWSKLVKWDAKRRIKDTFFACSKEFVISEAKLVESLKRLRPFSKEENGSSSKSATK